MSNVELDELRSRLDGINAQLLELISERAGIVQEIGACPELRMHIQFEKDSGFLRRSPADLRNERYVAG